MNLDSRHLARLAVLISIAVTLSVAESLIPKPIPWLRLGLANGVALLVLVRVSFAAALLVTTLRILLGGLLLGTLGAPPFVLSAAGSLCALVIMAAAWRVAVPPLSLLGVSVLGSSAHVMGQLVALSATLELGRAVIALAPILVTTAVPLGVVTGAVILAVHRRLPAW